MLKKTQNTRQQKIAPWTYGLLLLGIALAATGQCLIHGQVGSMMVFFGILLVSISCMLAIIVYPSIVGF